MTVVKSVFLYIYNRTLIEPPRSSIPQIFLFLLAHSVRYISEVSSGLRVVQLARWEETDGAGGSDGSAQPLSLSRRKMGLQGPQRKAAATKRSPDCVRKEQQGSGVGGSAKRAKGAQGAALGASVERAPVCAVPARACSGSRVQKVRIPSLGLRPRLPLRARVCFGHRGRRALGWDGRQELNKHQCVPCQPEPVQVRVYRKCSFPRWVAARDSG